MKKIILIIFLTFFFINPQEVSAQGTYKCSPAGTRSPLCAPDPSGCDEGYIAGDNCNVPSSFTCPTGEFNCIRTPEKPPPPKFSFEAVTSGALSDFKFTNIGDVISRFLLFAFPAAGMLLLLYLLYGGFRLMTSGGDPKAVEAAKAKITTAVIGFVIIFAAYWIVQIVARVLGLQGITNIFQ